MCVYTPVCNILKVTYSGSRITNFGLLITQWKDLAHWVTMERGLVEGRVLPEELLYDGLFLKLL